MHETEFAVGERFEIWVKKLFECSYRIFSVASTNLTLPYTINDIQSNKRCNRLTHAQVDFRQSNKSSLPRGWGNIVNTIEGGGWGEELTGKNPTCDLIFQLRNSLKPQMTSNPQKQTTSFL